MKAMSALLLSDVVTVVVPFLLRLFFFSPSTLLQGAGPYTASIKQLETNIVAETKRVNELIGIRESDTGLAPPSQWDLTGDKQAMQEEQPLMVARCTKIINAGADDAKYLINLKQMAKFVVALGDKGE